MNRPSGIGRIVLFGFIGTLLFLCYFGHGIYLDVVDAKTQAQTAVAFVSYPTSALLYSVLSPLFDWLGPYGSQARRIGEWSCLGLAGSVQYFFIGTVLAQVTQGGRSAND